MNSKMTFATKLGKDYAVIEKAQKELEEYELKVAEDRKAFVKEFGNGPHKMPLPDGRTLVAVFRKNGDTYKVNALDLDSVD